MTDLIEEIPIESEKKEEIKEIEICQTQDIQEDIPKKRSRGRPAGAKNKAKAKPKAKPKVKKKQRPVEYDEEGESEYEEEIPPPMRRKITRQPQSSPELDRRALAADVLGILQEQRYQRTSARRNHYASWFENM